MQLNCFVIFMMQHWVDSSNDISHLELLNKSHQQQLLETFSFQTLAGWVKHNGHKLDSLLRTDEESFIDSNGIRRYTSNWQPMVELSGEQHAAQLFEKTGCARITLQCTQQRKSSSTSNKITEIDLLHDWQRLWSFLYEDEEDEIAKHAPLLRHLVEACFHRRTCQLVIFLFFYNLACYIISDILYANGNPIIYSIACVITVVIITIVYLACLVLNKGKDVAFAYLTGSPLPTTLNQTTFNHEIHQTEISNQISQETTTASTATTPQYYSVHWTASMKQLFHCACNEAKTLWKKPTSSSTTSSAQMITPTPTTTKPSISFYRVVNISLKILSRYNRIDTRISNFDRLSYRLVLLFTIYILPIYTYFYNNLFLNLRFVVYCMDDRQSETCLNNLLFFTLTGGYITRALLQYIFAASVLVSLVGLAYAGEGIYQLTHAWIKKFRSLRRVKIIDHSCHIVSSHLPLFPATTAATETSKLTASSLLHSRYEGSKQSNDHNKKIINSSSPLFELLKRDATEHYLIIREIVKVSSEIWSPALTGFFFLIFYAVIIGIAYFTLYVNTSDDILTLIFFLLYVIVRILIYFAYPILSISHANAYIYEIKEMFAGTALDDFLILGGREYWIAFVEACPIVWTYYGIWITWDRLEGVLYTGVAGLIALVTSAITTSSVLFVHHRK